MDTEKPTDIENDPIDEPRIADLQQSEENANVVSDEKQAPIDEEATPLTEGNEATGEQTEAVAAEEEGIWEPASSDILCGRGAYINSNLGNKRFRALCFAHKSQFEAANHAAKRVIVGRIVTKVLEQRSRFLRKNDEKGPWYEMTKEEAILKAAQVIRDYKRPDRMAQRELMNASGKKRNRAISTPMDDVELPPEPEQPIIDFPRGVNKNDVLSGRGAYVNGHVGNQQMRKLAIERKVQFDAGNYTIKRQLAMEIVNYLRSLDPPGRFLKCLDPRKPVPKEANVVAAPEGDECGWEELGEEKAIHKACQVMRDLDRADRRERDERRRLKKVKKKDIRLEPSEEIKDDTSVSVEAADIVSAAEAAAAETELVEAAVAAAEYAMDKALEAASAVKEVEEPLDSATV